MGASAKTVQGLARWLERCNAREAVIKELVPFTITGHDKPLGYMLPSCVAGRGWYSSGV